MLERLVFKMFGLCILLIIVLIWLLVNKDPVCWPAGRRRATYPTGMVGLEQSLGSYVESNHLSVIDTLI